MRYLYQPLADFPSAEQINKMSLAELNALNIKYANRLNSRLYNLRKKRPESASITLLEMEAANFNPNADRSMGRAQRFYTKESGSIQVARQRNVQLTRLLKSKKTTIYWLNKSEVQRLRTFESKLGISLTPEDYNELCRLLEFAKDNGYDSEQLIDVFAKNATKQTFESYKDLKNFIIMNTEFDDEGQVARTKILTQELDRLGGRKYITTKDKDGNIQIETKY